MKMIPAAPAIQNLKHVAAGRSDLFRVPEHLITIVPGFNAREDFGDLKLLGAQILSAGGEVKKPITVRVIDGQIQLVDGERRLRAVRMLVADGHVIAPLPCMPETRGTTDADRTLSLLVLNDGKPLTILEEAKVIHDLGELHGLANKEIAERTGRSIVHVRNCLALIAAPDSVQRAVAKGRIAGSLVIDLIKETKGDGQALEEKVTAAIESAEAKGKDHASRKDVSPSTQTPSTSTPANPVGTVPFSDIPSAGGNPGEPRLSRDTTGNLKKINAMLEKLDAGKCIPALRETVELMVDILEGNQAVSILKKKLLLEG